MDDRPRTDTWALIGIAAGVALVHLFTNGRYGFHRDELQVLSDARHLDWGFVPYPPFTPLVERIGLSLFGLSLVGLRLFSVIIAGIGHPLHRTDGARAWRWAVGAGDGGAFDRTLGAASIRRDRVSIHDIRLFVVGADCLLRDSSAEDGESAVVAGDRRRHRDWLPDEVHHGVLYVRDCGRRSPHAGAPVSLQRMALGLEWRFPFLFFCRTCCGR